MGTASLSAATPAPPPRLGRKQTIAAQARWYTLLQQAPTLVPAAVLEAKIDRTVADIRRVGAGQRMAFGWSGGKDSLVLGQLMRLAGVTDCVLVLTYLEYPQFLRWVTDHMPPDLTVLRTRHDLGWLAVHPHLLFPRTAALAAQWFHRVQHWGQTVYVQRQQIAILAVGRRRLDGNFCGPPDGYTNRLGVRRYAPMADWTHEEVFAALAYFGDTLPPCYQWPRGFQVGTGPWPARQFAPSLRVAWDEVWSIDQHVVLEAARCVPAAAAYLAIRDAEGL